MQCDTDIVYQNLLKNLKRINASMRDLELANLPSLLDEHDSIMNSIKEIGIIKDQKLKDLIDKNINQVQNVIFETEKVQMGIANQLKTIGNKKKINSAYSENKDY